jgi:hypothetical protein
MLVAGWAILFDMKSITKFLALAAAIEPKLKELPGGNNFRSPKTNRHSFPERGNHF